MKPLKISIFGADGFTCQAPRIKEGMKNLGHTISEDDPDVIYANDPSGYSRALQLKNSFPKSFLMLFNESFFKASFILSLGISTLACFLASFLLLPLFLNALLFRPLSLIFFVRKSLNSLSILI